MAELGYKPISCAPESSTLSTPPHSFTCSYVNMGFELFLFPSFKSSDGDESYRALQLGGKARRNNYLEAYTTNGIYRQDSQSGVMGKKGLNLRQTSQTQALAR